MASDKTIFGAEEGVVIEPYGIKVPARIDTGAATTSLDYPLLPATPGYNGAPARQFIGW